MRLIIHDMPEGWQWVAIEDDGVIRAHSTVAFATRVECVQDAARSGFLEHVTAIDSGG